MEKQNLSSLIWSTADDVLRGMFKPSEYGRIILPFVVLRRLDCVLEPQKDKAFELHEKYEKKLKDFTQVIQSQLDLPFFNVSKFDLLRIKSDPNNVYKNFNNYIQGYSKNVLDIIENFQIDPLITKLNKNKKLYLIIDKFTEFDLHPNKIDNHTMGSVYEELLRKFSEMSNEESGDHFTPRDIVKLLVSLVFGGDKENLKGEDKIRSVYDPCCGTGGMLTIGKEWIHENINKKLKVELFGQELNDITYAICKSDFLMSDENPENIKGPFSSLSEDGFSNRKFDYMITNPPFGVSWKSEVEFVKNESKDPNGRFFIGTPRTSDGSLLFLQHLIHKMEPSGSRIGIIFNGSSLFTGDAGSGESEIRKWIIEKDMLECVIELPDRMFFNTSIKTYLWVVTNKKSINRKGKIQLIDGSSFGSFMKKNLGDKSKYINDENIKNLINIYKSNSENEFSKIYNNSFFGYTKVIVEQPLIENQKIKKDKKGSIKPDTSKRDYERIPLNEDIDEYYDREVKPFLEHSWMDRTKDKIGYEINFTKYFYKFSELRSLELISNDLKNIDDEISKISNDLINEK
jgi:type I restriction enzyme M protein